MGWSWLFGVLMLVGIVLLIVVLVRLFAGGASSNSPATPPAATPTTPDRARQILDERFAKGELTAEQYREQIQVLGEHRP